MATKAQLPLLGPLGLEPLQQLCSGGWVVLKSSILRKACLGQEASSTASLGASVLPKLRQDESQATKLLLHLLHLFNGLLQAE